MAIAQDQQNYQVQTRNLKKNSSDFDLYNALPLAIKNLDVKKFKIKIIKIKELLIAEAFYSVEGYKIFFF